MRILPADASIRRRNRCSVAFNAPSGMLLIRPTANSGPSVCTNLCCAGARAGLSIGLCSLNGSIMSSLAGLLRGFEPRRVSAGLGERLVDILDDVGDVFDSDRKPDRFRKDAGHALLFGRHLAMCGRGWMAGERFGVADIDQARDQLQLVVEG